MSETTAMTEASGLRTDEARIDQAAEAIRSMTTEMVVQLPVRYSVFRAVRELTIQAPLQSLAVAFLLGVIVASRRT
jgi:hypothetical protein